MPIKRKLAAIMLTDIAGYTALSAKDENKALALLDKQEQILTTLEGKYNYKLFQHDGSIIEDRMFLPKFVALPTILYLLMVVLLFILSLTYCFR